MIREISAFPKLACKFDATPFKTRTSFFKGLDKLILNVYGREIDKVQAIHFCRRIKWRNLPHQIQRLNVEV